jgi:hypothetical protein
MAEAPEAPAELAQVHEAHVRRLAAIDPLVRVRELDVTSRASDEWREEWSADRQAVALVDVRETDPSSEPALWVEDRIVRLQLRAATDEAAHDALDLLERAGRAGGPGTTYVSVASRDTALIAPLIRAGFAPKAVLAVHRLPRPELRSATRDAGRATVRTAVPADLDTVVAANVAVQAFDAYVGSLPTRPDAEQVIRPHVEQALRDRAGWNWVAEQDGSVVAAAHLRATAAGAQVVALHHAASNPLSAPFWGRAGYRPLVTTWARIST